MDEKEMMEERIRSIEEQIKAMRKIQNDILYVLGKTFIK